MNRIFGLGTAAVDFRIVTPEMGEGYTQKLIARKTEAFGGGAAANCLTQAARLGGKTYYLGRLGDDPIGKEIVRLLEGEGISCECVIKDAKAHSPFNIAVYAGEKKRRVGGYLLPNSLAAIDGKDIDFFISHIETGDWVIAEIGEVPLDSVADFLLKAKKKGAKTVLDVDLDPIVQLGADTVKAYEMFDLADVLIPNMEALEHLYKQNNPEKLAREISWETGAAAVITCGSGGAYVCEPGKEAVHFEAKRIEPVDTVGAGDAFHGGFMYAMSAGKSIYEAVALATECAARNCMKFGAREGMPRKEELIKEGLM